MNGLTLEQLIADMNDDNSVDKPGLEKVAQGEDMTHQLLNTLKGKVEEDMKDSVLEKKASKAATVFGDLATQKIASAMDSALEKMASDEYIEKIAERVVSMLIEKLAVETNSNVVNDFSDPAPKVDPQTSIEAESKKVGPEVGKAQAAKEKLLNRKVVEGVSASGAQGEKVAMDEELVQKIMAALADDE